MRSVRRQLMKCQSLGTRPCCHTSRPRTGCPSPRGPRISHAAPRVMKSTEPDRLKNRHPPEIAAKEADSRWQKHTRHPANSQTGPPSHLVIKLTRKQNRTETIDNAISLITLYAVLGGSLETGQEARKAEVFAWCDVEILVGSMNKEWNDAGAVKEARRTNPDRR